MIASAITHRTVEANGIRLHIAEQGEGPVVVLCHGFPESWYSWRHQLAALSAAGFRAIAPHRCQALPIAVPRGTARGTPLVATGRDRAG